jgi:hypothetical protein
MFNRQRNEVIFKLLTLNAVKFLLVVNGLLLTLLNFKKLLTVNI